MKKTDKETLSQLMDGEWQDIDSQAHITELCQQQDMQAVWARYHLIRDVMKNESVKVDTGIAARVSAALEAEPAHSNVTFIGGEPTTSTMPEPAQTQPAERSAWRSSMGGLAVAASVALATVIGLDYWRSDTTPGQEPQTVAALPAVQSPAVVPGQVLPQIELVANRGSYWVNSEATNNRNASNEDRLNMFLSQHIEHSPTTSHQGMLPYSRLVGYDASPAQ